MTKANWKYRSYPQKQVEILAKRMKARWKVVKAQTGMTQTGLANRLGITQRAISQFFGGVTPMNNEMIMKICTEIGVKPKDMVKGLRFFEPFFRKYA